MECVELIETRNYRFVVNVEQVILSISCFVILVVQSKILSLQKRLIGLVQNVVMPISQRQLSVLFVNPIDDQTIILQNQKTLLLL